jgi:hypothetical protein
LAAIDFAGDVEAIGGTTLDELKKKVAQTPNDVQAWYNIAVLLFVKGKPKDAIKAGCTCLLRDKTWNDGAAKKLVNRSDKNAFRTPHTCECPFVTMASRGGHQFALFSPCMRRMLVAMGPDHPEHGWG